ncbi:Fimbrial assembly protein (PilN) [Caloranaerobacter azorensis DSM 13643]|uniref:Fimbrial assembly protein (PilN) n=1 Tax=Caloranaerobacter azorensis DSM 13643 TaxID=1121264 RepID=A0A1M5RWE6_9FIRM|nr:PilN domain-containing protein [Caloranaerobacter azorensis]SHH30564.1 Fimbrial assembly protein (PilN) [Caloranaerobacter azorensis DSM 13643]
MKDINLFSHYIGNKKFYKKEFLYIGIIAATMFILLTTVTLTNIYKIKSLKNEIKMLESYLESENTKEKLAEIESKNNRFKIMKQYYNTLVDINEELKKQDIINTDFLEKIASTLPDDVYLNVMNISLDNLQIQGIANSRVSIAKLQHNLRELGLFSKVVVININEEKSQNRYIFSLKCILKGSEG